MPWTAADSRIKVDKSLEEKVAAARSGIEISEILRQAMLDQHLIVADEINKSVYHELAPPEPKAFTRTITEAATGRQLTFNGSTELELERALGEYFRALQPTEPARDAQG